MVIFFLSNSWYSHPRSQVFWERAFGANAIACEGPDAFPVVASLPIFRRERSDDRKCVWRFAGYWSMSKGIRATWLFSKFLGFSIIFPKILDAIWSFPKQEFFWFLSPSHFRLRKLGFLFYIVGDPRAISRAGLKENVRRAFSPGPTDRPWVSEDTFSTKNGLLNLGNEIAKNKTVENRREFIW